MAKLHSMIGCQRKGCGIKVIVRVVHDGPWSPILLRDNASWGYAQGRVCPNGMVREDGPVPHVDILILSSRGKSRCWYAAETCGPQVTTVFFWESVHGVFVALTGPHCKPFGLGIAVLDVSVDVGKG